MTDTGMYEMVRNGTKSYTAVPAVMYEMDEKPRGFVISYTAA